MFEVYKLETPKRENLATYFTKWNVQPPLEPFLSNLMTTSDSLRIWFLNVFFSIFFLNINLLFKHHFPKAFEAQVFPPFLLAEDYTEWWVDTTKCTQVLRKLALSQLIRDRFGRWA